MPCDSCSQISTIISAPSSLCQASCLPIEDELCKNQIDSSCVNYSGTPLTCIGAASNLCLEKILQKIDSKVCEVTGDYSGFNLGCLRDKYAILKEKDFAQSIADYTCTMDKSLQLFINSTFPTSITAINNKIDGIINPAISSCGLLNITADDNIKVVLTKLSNGLCTTILSQDVSSANWDKCFTLVGSPPKTIEQGFNKVIDYICTIRQNGNGGLPIFDNTTSCLTNPTTTDSLSDTITKIKTRLCLTPIFQAANLHPIDSCIPFSNSSSLQEITVEIIDRISQLSNQTIKAVDNSQFTITDIDPANHCLGKKLSLNGKLTDRLVSINENDSPGFLGNKISAGSNIVIDADTIPGKLIISSNAPSGSNEKVKTSASDPVAGYLVEKITGNNSEINIITSELDNKVKVMATVNYTALIKRFIDVIAEDDELKGELCALLKSCPSPCSPPTNIQIIPA